MNQSKCIQFTLEYHSVSYVLVQGLVFFFRVGGVDGYFAKSARIYINFAEISKGTRKRSSQLLEAAEWSRQLNGNSISVTKVPEDSVR
jgi:hypothetical protein